MATIANAIQEIVDELRNVRDLRSVPDEPPENNDAFPFAVVVPATGEFRKESWGWMHGFHNISIELHVKREDLPTDYRQIVDIYDEIPLQLEKALQAGRFSAIETWTTIGYQFTPLNWAGVDTLGIIYIMNGVKLTRTVE